ncbi:MAG: EAL domain-containing protein [Gammaproteobacteria bacterium]|nr:EAL domain-containing protein [Gammaproteobacteria bacterium]MCB1800922.1 EAL domain-containing protein [Gammaproteobacteria bacterium]
MLEKSRKPNWNPLSPRLDAQSITAMGFGLVITIMLFAIVGSYRSTSEHNDQLSQLVRGAGLKTVLAYTMREAIRERVDTLRAMVMQDDPFERDELKMRFFAHASKYVRARNSLIGHMTTDAERAVIERLDATARSVGPPNNRALNALFDYSIPEQQIEAAVQASIDGHLLLLKHLDEAVRTIHQTTQNHITTAGDETKQALLAESALGFVAFVLAVVTATLVVVNTGARNRKLSHQAAHDVLTGLLNRQAFEAALRLTLEQSRLSPDSHALLFVDLDRFKLVNDSCGHAAGDALLKELAELLTDRLRYSDLVGRIGGDEFGILLRFTESGDAERVAEKVRSTVESFRFRWEDKSFQVGASIGMVTFGNEVITVEALLRTADACCYSAKEEGRNRVHRADAKAEQVQRRSGEMRWINRIGEALQEDRFVLFGQLISPMSAEQDDGRLSLEVLLRMRDEDGLGLIPPGQFLPAAERYGIVPDIDRWVVRHALEWLAGLGGKANELRISINICGPAASDPQFHRFVRDQIHRTGIPPRSVCFEITESVAISNLSNAAALVEALGDLGCQFALDDFGSGLSSFSQLRHLAVDYLKIDGGFIHNIDRDPINRAMVESINNIGQKLGKRTVAEFVENQRIHRILDEIGVDYAQGFALHKPEPLGDIETRILGVGAGDRTPREAFVA